MTSTPLFLSRLVLNPMQRQVQHDLADCYAMHQRILSAFPDGIAEKPQGHGHAREQFGVLYRVEVRRDGSPVALVQSRAAPDWSHLPSGYLSQPPAMKQIDGAYAAVRAGMTFTFHLRANPVKRISRRNATQGERWRGKRVDLRREEDQIAWLARKGEAAGFALLTVRARPALRDVRALSSAAAHGMRPTTGRLTFGAVVLEGHLRVTDPDAFRAALETGIGSGKAFGFGLLSIAPSTIDSTDKHVPEGGW